MAAEHYDIEDFEQGTTFRLEVTVRNPATGAPADLTDHIARSMARKQYSDAAPAWAFDVSIPDPLTGVVVMEKNATDTAAFIKGRYYYDLELESPAGVVVKLIKGVITVTPEATK